MAATGWLRAKEVAELFGVAPSTVARWARSGRLPSHHTLGGHHRFLEVEVLSLFELEDEPAPVHGNAPGEAVILPFVPRPASHGGRRARRRRGA